MTRTYLKVGLSFFIVYHLATILVLPNSDSIISRKISPVLAPYANALGLNTSWRFFSPEPSPTIFFVYDADMTDGGVMAPKDQFWRDRGFITGRWPPENPKGMIKENVKRLVYHSRFATMSRDRVEKFMGSLLCRFFPKAQTVSVRAVMREIPSIEKSVLTEEEFGQSSRERDMDNFEFSCAKDRP